MGRGLTSLSTNTAIYSFAHTINEIKPLTSAIVVLEWVPGVEVPDVPFTALPYFFIFIHTFSFYLILVSFVFLLDSREVLEQFLGTGSTRERAGCLVIVSRVYKGDLPPVEWSTLLSPLLVLQP